MPLLCRIFGHKLAHTVSQLSTLSICQRRGCIYARILDNIVMTQERREALTKLLAHKLPVWRPRQ